MAEMMETGGARVHKNEDTGEPFFELWGAGWKDSEDLDPHEPFVLCPHTLPEGSTVTVCEPDSPEAHRFYERFAALGAHVGIDEAIGPELPRWNELIQPLTHLRQVAADFGRCFEELDRDGRRRFLTNTAVVTQVAQHIEEAAMVLSAAMMYMDLAGQPPEESR